VKGLFGSMLVLFPFVASAGELPNTASSLLRQACSGCHDKETSEGGLDLTALSFDLNTRAVRERWVRIHDRIEKGEMPPRADDLPKGSRTSLVKSLQGEIYNADLADSPAQRAADWS
jgi:hypothetical protein